MAHLGPTQVNMLHLVVHKSTINDQRGSFVTQFAVLDDQVLQIGEKWEHVWDGRDLVRAQHIIIQIQNVFWKVVENVYRSCLQFSADTLVYCVDDIIGDCRALVS